MPPQTRRLVVVACDSTDEAALWAAALARTCAGATFRRLGVSTLERIAGVGDAEGLAQQGIGLAFVPRSDVLGGSLSRSNVVVIDPAQAHQPPPTGAWGRLVRAGANDLGAWVAATEALRDVLSVLSDHRDISPAWPLAMAEACEPNLLSATPDTDFVSLVERELVACQPRALATSAYLTAIVNDRVLGSTQDDPESWYDKLSAVPAGSPVDGVAGGLVRKYLDTASRNPRWLAAERPGREDATQLLRDWSAMPANQALVAAAFTTAYTTAAEQRRPASPAAGAQAVDSLVRDGLTLPESTAPALLGAAAGALLNESDPGHTAMLSLDLCADTRKQLAILVDDLLRDRHAYGTARTLPAAPPAALAWLVPGLELGTLRQVRLETALARLQAEPDRSNAVGLAQALQGLPGGPQLPEYALNTLAEHLTAGQALALPESLPGWWRIAGPCLMRNPGEPAAVEFARRHLGSIGLSEHRLGQGRSDAHHGSRRLAQQWSFTRLRS
ncbi:hypothetical protein [Actinomyces sp. 432]|uniref:hypothetical protein n=1 Tax=Actinomyces sp. 432 TaxID=2057798 RepID=UPI00137A0638|nr:hypothetical protein [Actinomyces sp. 432]